jgi:hypothetical protein
MRRPRAFLLASLLPLVPLVTCGPASLAHAQGTTAPAPGKERAKKLFEEGVELEKKADYAGALAKYKEAEQITVTPGLRFHKGYCLEMLGKLAAALDEYDAADRLAREQNKQEVHTAILVRSDPLRPRVPQIAIRVSTPVRGADVELDGAAVAAALLEGKAFRIDPGEHTVTAHAAGYKTFTRKVQAPESVTTTVDISLERAAAPAAAVAAVPVAASPAQAGAADPGPVTEPPREPSRGSRALPLATTAGAVALAGAGVAFFLVAAGAQSDAQRDCATKTTCDDEQSRVRTFDALALGSFIGAAGLGVVSVVLWTSRDASRTAAVASASAPAPARPHARVLATPTMVGLEGSF